MRSTKAKIGRAVVFVVLLLISIVFISPFIWTLFTSFKPDDEIYTAAMHVLPQSPTIEHYTYVFSKMGNFFKYFKNSVITSVWTLLFVTIFSCTMGYAFSKCEFAFKNLYRGFVLMVLTLPLIIYLIPIYIMNTKLHVINTVTGLVLPYIATNLPMAVFIMQGQYANVPVTLTEAARLDGANSWQVFSKVVLPCVKPGIATVIIYTFINVWGEFTYAKTLTSSAVAQTLPVGIVFLKDEASSWAYGTLTSVIVMSLIPVLIIFLSMQKYFVKGIMEGALKG